MEAERAVILKTLYDKIRQVISRMIPYRDIQSAERIQTPLSTDMVNAQQLWYDMYHNQAPWVDGDKVKSLNLPAYIASEISRQVTLECDWHVTGKQIDTSGEPVSNPRAEYIAGEMDKLRNVIRSKLEAGCASGGMIIKPYVNTDDGHIYFDFSPDWSIYPVAFDDDGNLSDVVIPDTYRDGDTIYTRLERHEATKTGVHITQRAYRSSTEDTLGREIALTDVERWSSLAPEADVPGIKRLYGWYKVPMANNVDSDTAMGASVFSRATGLIKQADIQYSRLLWEYEASEMAIDVDPYILRPHKGKDGRMEAPQLNDRLFRAVDGEESFYSVFAPTIRDESYLSGLNQLLCRVEDLCGLSRGTLSDADASAKTATELKIMRQRSYATIHDNQQALERCLRDVAEAVNRYADAYNLAPAGEYDISFDWDDSVITDTDTEAQTKLMLLNAGVMSKAEYREWYFGETPAQAEAAIQAAKEENSISLDALDITGEER